VSRAALTDETVDRMTRLAVAVRALQAGDPGAKAWSSLGLSMAQLKALLHVVETGGAKNRDLARAMAVGPSAITPLVDALVDKQLVRRAPDPEDRRVVHVRPTAKGIALREKLLATSQSAWRQVLAQVRDVDDLARIHAALGAMLDAAERARR
jgi:DNA-binding MarR family transcriptional regulator